MWFDVCEAKRKTEFTVYGLMYVTGKKRAFCVWFDVCERKKELTVYGLMYVKEKQQQSFQCKVQCMQRKNNNRAYSVWFDVCEGKTTTEFTVYGSMYVKEKTTELTVYGSTYVKEKTHRAYSVWFDVCERKTTTKLTVYGSMYAKYGFRFSYNLFSLSCTACCSCTEMKINGEVTVLSSTEGVDGACLVNRFMRR